MALNGRRPLTRYAPSPTGHVHLGHVAHMLYVWGIAELLDGEVLLRIEDHDRQRCRPGFESGLLRDLDWLGFEPANAVAGAASTFRQSDCEPLYAEALDALSSRHHVYRCVCTRKALAGIPGQAPHGERPYPGTCRDARQPATVPHGVRLAWDRTTGTECFEDGLLGPQVQEPRAQCGDLLLRDRYRQWTYQFAVTVDDIRHGVDFVVRGRDLLESTGRQLRLARLLGASKLPRYYHHPLVLDQRGEKLSKNQRSRAIRDLRNAGASPGAVLGAAASAVGLLPEERPVEAGQAADLVQSFHRNRIRTGAIA